MSRRLSFELGVCLGLALLGSGCDAAKEPMAQARAAEAAGKLADARSLYAEVCKKAETSPYCPVAKQRAEALAVKEAMELVAQGQYGKVKELGAAVSGAPAKRALEALSKTSAVTPGIAFDEAAASADKAAARAKMEEIAATSAPVAPKAREWLTKNGPALLLEEVKAACTPSGTGSCMELGKKMAKLSPGSAEAGEAKALVDAEYKRLYPLLKQAEGLLVQRLEIFNWKAKVDLCLQTAEPAPGGDEMQVCKTNVNVPEDRGDPFSTSAVDSAWDKKLDEIHDPGRVAALKARWALVESGGVYDPATLPKPGDKDTK